MERTTRRPAFLALAAALLAAPLGAAPSAAAPLTSVDTFFETEHSDRPYRIRGTVADTFTDDVDPRFVYFTLEGAARQVLCSVRIDSRDPSETLALSGRRVELRGAVRTASSLIRRAYLGKMFLVESPDDIRLLGDDPDPFDVPELALADGLRPDQIVRFGRRRVAGCVLAVWGGRNVLLQPDAGRPIRAILATDRDLPAYGQRVDIVGRTETDTYNIALTHARWRAAGGIAPLVRIPTPVPVRSLLVDERGNRRFETKFHGAVLRVSGTVRGMVDVTRGRFEIESTGGLIAVDASSLDGELDDLTRGCEVEVVGTCVVDADLWRADEPFPRIRGIVVVPSLPGDVRITASAPWLTPARAWTIFYCLAAFVVAIALWNRILWLRAFRSGKALADEEVARAEADMRTRERTRLAVELHDSIVQNLAGVIMELETAKRMIVSTNEEPLVHLRRAERAMRSCHADLRNCLWDLRSEALEDADMSQAIRTTLLPHLRDATIDVRFNVPRAAVSDNTAYVILRVIRELTLNAIKHGGAKHVKIAGAEEGRVLRFSVRDDGAGFDPDAAPGVTEGHFGLEGIRQRVRSLSGTFAMERTAEGGMRAVVTIPIPAAAEAKR